MIKKNKQKSKTEKKHSNEQNNIQNKGFHGVKR